MNLDPETQSGRRPILGPAPSREGGVRLAIFLFVGMLNVVLILAAILVLSKSGTDLHEQIPAELVDGNAGTNAPGFALPVVGGAQPFQPAPSDFVITLSSNGDLYAAGRPYEMPDLRLKLQDLGEIDAGMAVLIRADGEAPTQNLMDVLSACRESGLTKIGFVLNTPNSPQAAAPGGVR